MFPKWSDWDMQYTRQGLLKKQVRRACGVILLLGIIVGSFALRQRGSGVFSGVQSLNHLLRSYVKQGLFSAMRLVNTAIKMLPD